MTCICLMTFPISRIFGFICINKYYLYTAFNRPDDEYILPVMFVNIEVLGSNEAVNP